MLYKCVSLSAYATQFTRKNIRRIGIQHDEEVKKKKQQQEKGVKKERGSKQKKSFVSKMDLQIITSCKS